MEVLWTGLLFAFLGAEVMALLNPALGDTFSEWVWTWPLWLRVVLALLLVWAAWHFVTGNCWPLC